MTIKSEKKEIRLAMLERLKSNHNKIEKETSIKQTFINQDVFKNAQSIGITMSMEHEFDTRWLIDYAKKYGKKVYVPFCDYKSKQMHFVRYTSDEDIVKDSFGIDIMNHQLEYDTYPDLLIVPGVVFNEKGYRIGYGGGYFDKYLSHFKGKTVSLIFELQFGEVLIENHDIPVQMIITEDRIINNEVQS
ncbi:5-formyltetrahydrofolate cyclo-ligase [Macrococcus animalis]|uniref:5-formyltetrahydrofolate cyclo-ligase n=1 Tax=Macrococcus animalis TaxID=3395467 RepID=UPI0039BF5BFA